MAISNAILFSGAVVMFIALEVYIILRQKKSSDKTKDKNSNKILDRSINAAILIGILFYFVDFISIPGSRETRFFAGSIVMWAGLLIRLWAVGKLGTAFTTVVMAEEKQKVVASGPYRFIRHPAYAGSILVFIGFGISMGNAIGLALITGVILFGYLQRIRVEEQALLSTIGDRYKNYMADTKRIIPFIY